MSDDSPTFPRMSEDSEKAWREILREFDRDESGTVSLRELGAMMPLLGLDATPDDVDFLAKHFDNNGDGRLSIDEIIKNHHVLHEHSLNGEQLIAAFRTVDRNGDGFIRLPELLAVLMHDNFMQVDEARALLTEMCKEFDRDGDGKFNYAEFVEIVNSKSFQSKTNAAHERHEEEQEQKLMEEAAAAEEKEQEEGQQTKDEE